MGKLCRIEFWGFVRFSKVFLYRTLDQSGCVSLNPVAMADFTSNGYHHTFSSPGIDDSMRAWVAGCNTSVLIIDGTTDPPTLLRLRQPKRTYDPSRNE